MEPGPIRQDIYTAPDADIRASKTILGYCMRYDQTVHTDRFDKGQGWQLATETHLNNLQNQGVNADYRYEYLFETVQTGHENKGLVKGTWVRSPPTKFIWDWNAWQMLGGEYWYNNLDTNIHQWGKAIDTASSTDIGRDAFDEMFANAPSKTIKRVCETCASSHKEIFYLRLTPVPSDKSIYDIVHDPYAPNNVLGVDYKLYAHIADVKNQQNEVNYAWMEFSNHNNEVNYIYKTFDSVIKCPVNYVPIKTASECKTATAALSGFNTYSGSVNLEDASNIPSNCVYSGSDVHFNTYVHSYSSFPSNWGSPVGMVCKESPYKKFDNTGKCPVHFLPVESANECRDAFNSVKSCIGDDNDSCLQNKWAGAGGPECSSIDEACGFKLVAQEGSNEPRELRYLWKKFGQSTDENFNIGPDLADNSYEEVVIKWGASLDKFVRFTLTDTNAGIFDDNENKHINIKDVIRQCYNRTIHQQ
jgi:hypothetical protein